MPDRQQIVVSTVTDALAVFEDVFDVGVVKKGLNEITALLSVGFDLKKRGDLFPVIFQRKAVAQQFVLRVRRIIVIYLAPGIEVVTA